MPFFIIGLVLILGGIGINIAMQFPWTSALIGGIFGEGVTSGFDWIAGSLEIIIPLGLFAMMWKFVGPVIAGAVSLVIGFIMWGILLL